MRRTFFSWLLRVAAVVALIAAWATLPVVGQGGAGGGEWRSYGSDLANTRYSPFTGLRASIASLC